MPHFEKPEPNPKFTITIRQSHAKGEVGGVTLRADCYLAEGETIESVAEMINEALRSALLSAGAGFRWRELGKIAPDEEIPV